MKKADIDRMVEDMTTNRMRQRTKELAEQAGFVVWDGAVDWSCNYDDALEKFAELVRADGPPCKTHPDAPHGFDRNASHSADRYVCECEGWEPPELCTKVRTNSGVLPKEWIGLDHEQMRNTPIEFNRGALWAERYLKERNHK